MNRRCRARTRRRNRYCYRVIQAPSLRARFTPTSEREKSSVGSPEVAERCARCRRCVIAIVGARVPQASEAAGELFCANDFDATRPDPASCCHADTVACRVHRRPRAVAVRAVRGPCLHHGRRSRGTAGRRPLRRADRRCGCARDGPDGGGELGERHGTHRRRQGAAGQGCDGVAATRRAGRAAAVGARGGHTRAAPARRGPAQAHRA